MLVVVALGGNALLKRGEPLEADLQRQNIKVAAKAIAKVAKEHRVVVCHGNGPQVGLLALQSAAYTAVNPYPLDVLDAETQGMIGYLLEQELRNELPEREVVTLLTQIEVDKNDRAFLKPSKPIGPVYKRGEAEKLSADNGWAIAKDGEDWRRVVPSPQPKNVVELKVAQTLIEQETLVIFGGGGGIPVVRDENRRLAGIEAVIDKDNTASLIAERIEADALLILTDVDAVYINWGTFEQKAIKKISLKQLQRLSFAGGSMGPKIEAATSFVDNTGKFATIGKLSKAEEMLEGAAGTKIVLDLPNIEYY